MNAFIKGEGMPKIIENVREQLLDEAKRQIRECGYSKTTIRSVAGACGLGVGTVYNYFSSKDMLIASFILDDWTLALNEMKNAPSDDPCEFLRTIYSSLSKFMDIHKSLFNDADAFVSFNSSKSNYHSRLRGQIALMIEPMINEADTNASFTAEFIAESLLTWTVEGKSFEDIYSVLKLIIKK